ncbi:hypothetical protein [Acetonema longum]|uniref:Outer membrane protein beta-barrel domain-containing protein n=1 Tax=Acetonema longum DSM 6540 TaxID=1009370 RepID=F7NP65_9FIRM|nr:hypothetical protein [Acetonema longum]EGO62188.1 hypothetical protein ALO_19542 [Acetonema longum DSM 6540]
MKKLLLTLAAVWVLCAGTALAAPVNNLYVGGTAAGYMFQAADPDAHTLYLEHQLFEKVAIGLQISDVEGWSDTENDLYGQLLFSDNFRGIVGVRDYGPESDLYLGAALNGELAEDTEGYASMIIGGDFDEFQVGINYRIHYGVDLNVNYKSTSYDGGYDRNGFGLGLTFLF